MTSLWFVYFLMCLDAIILIICLWSAFCALASFCGAVESYEDDNVEAKKVVQKWIKRLILHLIILGTFICFVPRSGEAARLYVRSMERQGKAEYIDPEVYRLAGKGI